MAAATLLAHLACSPLAGATPTPLPPPTVKSEPLPTAVQTETPESIGAELPFEAATYVYAEAGIALEFPASWTAGEPIVIGSRGTVVQLTSWERDPSVLPDEIPADGTMLQLGVMLWDPKNALDQWVAQRKMAWDGSGFEIVSEEELMLEGDWPALQFAVRTPFEESFFLLTTLDDRYLEVSGSGDLNLVSQIAATLRRSGP
jgi:hypothetical protein